jgi:transcriptional regulator with XRE-family HTH domain
MLHSFVEKSDGALLDPLPKARQEAGLTQAQAQAQVAEHRGTQTPAVARLERALATGRHSPSPATLHKVARACGKQLVLQLA